MSICIYTHTNIHTVYKTVPQKPLTPAFEWLFAPSEVSGSALVMVVELL